MHVSSYDGVEVEFPFEPYPLQKAYILQTIRALKWRDNAILESPTGTGKTLCLLCACLAWQRHVALQGVPVRAPPSGSSSSTGQVSTDAGASAGAMSKRPPKIIYASRTHAQLSHVVAELRKTTYCTPATGGSGSSSHTAVVHGKPPAGLRVVTLGSRDHLCVNPKLTSRYRNTTTPSASGGGAEAYNNYPDEAPSGGRGGGGGGGGSSGAFARPTGAALNAICRNWVKTKKCGYVGGCHRSSSKQVLTQLLDIEDLCRLGEQLRFCPYFISKDAAAEATLVLLPYRYLFDANVRRDFEEHLRGGVVIVDEAHNLERVAEDTLSFELSTAEVSAARAALDFCATTFLFNAGERVSE
eukprot:GHVU01024947.1.p1 GENE.GHVU01024947.1~~GHVU01024947.1.p1  ORF type:complete len:356 (-),score=78.98 GHVU01024947.1:109-1176(-)